MNKLLTLVCCLCIGLQAGAQYMGGGGRMGGGANRQNLNVGHFYGKLIDAKNAKPIAGATVQLTGNKFDTVTKQLKQAILRTVITEHNGDFSLESLSVMGNYKLKVSAIGYTALEKNINFGIKMPQPGEQPDLQKMLAQADKDLGNLKLEANAADLGNVTVTASSKPLFEVGIDRKIFNVDKNLVSTGQTATEIMKTIPSLSVDIDGNVTLRNASPTIFVDNRPTTLTLDQIPADIIEKVEIITNPSAKFDASGGNAGILNIVLKKNKKTGYNGGLRSGVDSRGRVNVGGDINVRQNKINLFASGMYNQRKSISDAITDRTNIGSKQSQIYQTNHIVNTGAFAFLRGGFDWFIDNRSTLSFTGNLAKGEFDNTQQQRVDSTLANTFYSFSNIPTNSHSQFNNSGLQVSYKYNFPKPGHNLSADVNYNNSNNSSNSNITTQTYLVANPNSFTELLQKTAGSSYSTFLTLQADYENPITEDTKLEAGVRSAIRNFRNDNLQYKKNPQTGQFEPITSVSSRYKFTDQVHAAYATYSFKVKRWSYQLGLRVESSNYDGTLLDKDSSFKVAFPLSLFPSAFVTYKLNPKLDVQINYSRRVNRPNFFQLLPFPDVTDPQNINIGNANLKPEFTHSFEMSYSNNYKKGANLLISAYFKYTDNLITRYQYKDKNPISAFATDSSIFNAYTNANSSITYGLEVTNKISLAKWWDATLNINFFNAQINATNVQTGLNNQLISWFGKMNNAFKFGKGYSIQLSGEYFAKTVQPQGTGGGGGGGRGGMMFGGGGQTATAQGYILPRYSIDLAIRKDWTWKNGKSGSLTLSMDDIFRTKLFQTTTESAYFYQTAQRRRDPQVLRLNFNYRFGKFDISLFKRKNTKADQTGGSDMIGN